jgi:hypothetical protein
VASIPLQTKRRREEKRLITGSAVGRRNEIKGMKWMAKKEQQKSSMLFIVITHQE